ncbi:hypothetical protein CB1_002132001 [Camelus ferus]|nr:hypothetical protein CB1_002132001 [Camelus ferus]
MLHGSSPNNGSDPGELSRMSQPQPQRPGDFHCPLKGSEIKVHGLARPSGASSLPSSLTSTLAGGLAGDPEVFLQISFGLQGVPTAYIELPD